MLSPVTKPAGVLLIGQPLGDAQHEAAVEQNAEGVGRPSDHGALHARKRHQVEPRPALIRRQRLDQPPRHRRAVFAGLVGRAVEVDKSQPHAALDDFVSRHRRIKAARQQTGELSRRRRRQPAHARHLARVNQRPVGGHFDVAGRLGGRQVDPDRAPGRRRLVVDPLAQLTLDSATSERAKFFLERRQRIRNVVKGISRHQPGPGLDDIAPSSARTLRRRPSRKCRGPSRAAPMPPREPVLYYRLQPGGGLQTGEYRDRARPEPGGWPVCSF